MTIYSGQFYFSIFFCGNEVFKKLSTSASRYSHYVFRLSNFLKFLKKLVSSLWFPFTYLGKWAWDWARWFVCRFALCFSISFGQQIELMFVDTAMPHMRKQEISQNCKTLPITALQTHNTRKKPNLGYDADFSCVRCTRTIISFIYMLFNLNRPTNRYCLLKAQALQNTQMHPQTHKFMICIFSIFWHKVNSSLLTHFFIGAATISPFIPALF